MMAIFRNTPYNRRRWLDFAISTAMTCALSAVGAGWWAMLTIPIALWNYYDGATRARLSRE